MLVLGGARARARTRPLGLAPASGPLGPLADPYPAPAHREPPAPIHGPPPPFARRLLPH